MVVSMTIDMSSAFEHMNDIEKNAFPLALTSAMSRSMFLISNKYLRKEIDRYVEGGAVRFSKSGILYQKASLSNVYAAVYYKKDRHYLGTITFGGKVKPHDKANVLIEPVNQKVNKYGNIPRGTLRRKKAQKHNYFVGRPGNRPYGLYRRYKKKAPSLVIKLDRKERNQESIFPAPQRSKRIFNRIWNDVFYDAMRYRLSKSQYSNPTGF